MMLLQSFPWLMTFSALVWSGADIKQYIVKFNKQYFPMFDLNVTSPSIVDCATLCDTFKMDTAFSYNIADELCLIHSKYMRSTTLVTNVKWQLYEPVIRSNCSLGGGTCDQLERCGGPHSIEGCTNTPTNVCCFDKSFGRDGMWNGRFAYVFDDGSSQSLKWSVSLKFVGNSINGDGIQRQKGAFTLNGSWDPLNKHVNFVVVYRSDHFTYVGQFAADMCTIYGQFVSGVNTGTFQITICSSSE